MASNGQSKTELSDQDLELISLLQWAPRITWGEAAEILDAHPTTLVICSSRADFLSRVVDDVRHQIPVEGTAGEVGAEEPPGLDPGGEQVRRMLSVASRTD